MRKIFAVSQQLERSFKELSASPKKYLKELFLIPFKYFVVPQKQTFLPR